MIFNTKFHWGSPISSSTWEDFITSEYRLNNIVKHQLNAVGGYYWYKDNFLKFDDPLVRALRRFIFDSAGLFLLELNMNNDHLLYQSWITNDCEPDFQARYGPNSFISGEFFLKHAQYSFLNPIDPRIGGVEDFFSLEEEYSFEPGDLIIFPSFLNYRRKQARQNNEFLSISFDIVKSKQISRFHNGYGFKSLDIFK